MAPITHADEHVVTTQLLQRPPPPELESMQNAEALAVQSSRRVPSMQAVTAVPHVMLRMSRHWQPSGLSVLQMQSRRIAMWVGSAASHEVPLTSRQSTVVEVMPQPVVGSQVGKVVL